MTQQQMVFNSDAVKERVSGSYSNWSNAWTWCRICKHSKQTETPLGNVLDNTTQNAACIFCCIQFHMLETNLLWFTESRWLECSEQNILLFLPLS